MTCGITKALAQFFIWAQKYWRYLRLKKLYVSETGEEDMTVLFSIFKVLGVRFNLPTIHIS